MRVTLKPCIVSHFHVFTANSLPFPHSMDAAMNELAPGNKITMKLSEDGSGRGAAIVAAVACRLTQKD